MELTGPYRAGYVLDAPYYHSCRTAQTTKSGNLDLVVRNKASDAYMTHMPKVDEIPAINYLKVQATRWFDPPL